VSGIAFLMQERYAELIRAEAAAEQWRTKHDALLQVVQKITAERDALRALLRQVRHHAPLPRGLEDAIDAALREGGK